MLAAAVQLRRSKQRERLIRRCRWMGLIAACISGALLIYDLGRPSRFFNMLRVFRPTSPMNMGVWILTATVGTSMMTLGLRNRNGLLGDIGDACGYASGIAGMGFATYTGVLVSSTAIPVWQESRRVLPVLFAASAMNSVGSVFEMFVEDPEERRITKAFGTAGQIAGMVAGIVMEKHASVVDRVGRPFKQGLSGVMWKTAAVLTATSAAVGVLPGRSRNKRLIAGALGTLGSILMRFAIQRAGVASARDARASFHQQRAAIER